MKPGYKTTEFWISVLAGAWSAAAPGVSPELQAAIPVIAAGVYALARGLAKGRGRELPPAPPALGG